MNDPKALRQVANDVGRVAAVLTEISFADGRELEALTSDLSTLQAAAGICRRMARRIEARKAQGDDKTPLCLGCRHRAEGTGGLACDLRLDTKEAVTRRHCAKYDPD